MHTMNIAFFEVSPTDQDIIRQKLADKHKLLFIDESLSEEHHGALQDTEILVLFVYSALNAETLEKLPKLRFIATMSTGFDHIDLNVCAEKGIVVSNVATYGEITVAEHTFALILALSHRIIESVDRVKSGYFSPQGLTGFDLYGKTIGVIGIGSIGLQVVRIAKGFGMKVLAYKRNPDPDMEKELDISIVDIPTLLQKSDIVSLHVPYSQETHHLIDEEKFYMMKKNAFIINTARGSVIDTRALLEALDKELIGGAGLDVIEGEPLLREEKELLSHEFNQEDLLHVIQERMLLNYPNVVVTPHNAFNSAEALQRILHVTLENIEAFCEGKPINVVSLQS